MPFFIERHIGAQLQQHAALRLTRCFALNYIAK